MKNLLGIAVLSIFMLTSISATHAGDKSKTAKTETAQIDIKGMTCEGCVNQVKTALEKVEGVKEVKVTLADNNATVVYDTKKSDHKKLENAVNSTGFKATKVKAVEKVKKSKTSDQEAHLNCGCGSKTGKSETKGSV